MRPNFYMIAGAGGNIGFQVGADGVVVVDSGSASSADAVVAAIGQVVRVTPYASTVIIVRQTQPTIRDGMPVRLTGTMP